VIDTGHWTTDLLLENSHQPYGFIYVITNTVNNKKYIGKKQCTSILKRKPLKGKKNKRHEVVETDWKTYTSSSLELNKDIELFGKDKFIFKIVRWCESKAELAYFETKMQFECDVLFRDDYYNGIINCRLCRFKIKS
jgi:hypothetical protein